MLNEHVTRAAPVKDRIRNGHISKMSDTLAKAFFLTLMTKEARVVTEAIKAAMKLEVIKESTKNTGQTYFLLKTTYSGLEFIQSGTSQVCLVLPRHKVNEMLKNSHGILFTGHEGVDKPNQDCNRTIGGQLRINHFQLYQ
jgi:hypothetical protein